MKTINLTDNLNKKLTREQMKSIIAGKREEATLSDEATVTCNNGDSFPVSSCDNYQELSDKCAASGDWKICSGGEQ